MRILPCGSTALLLELRDADEVRDWYAMLDQERLPGVVDLVPAARTLLVVTDAGPVRPDVAGFGPGRRAPAASEVAAIGTVADLADQLRAMQPDPRRRPGEAALDVLDVPVAYDGDDLVDVARALGCDPDQVVSRHTGTVWTVAFCGFAPGFGYLVPDGDPWDLPRRAVPRTRVPTGAVGLAGPYTGVYPRASPGGWQLIGRTPLDLFDVTRDPPALLVPGRRVRFHDVARGSSGGRRPIHAAARDVRVEPGSTSTPDDAPDDAVHGAPPEPTAHPSGSTRAPAEAPADALSGQAPRTTRPSAGTEVAPGRSTSTADQLADPALARPSLVEPTVRGPATAGPPLIDPVWARPALTVVAAGPSTTLQDGGRPGLASVGVSRSGAADRSSYALANRLVGNRSGTPALEVTAGGLVLRAEREVLVAVTGAPCIGAPDNACVRLRAGDELRLGTTTRGLRTYVAVRGGLAAPEVLHSCSTDSLSGLGPRPLMAGDVLALADAAVDLPPVDVAPRAPVGIGVDAPLAVRVSPGPRADWFRPGAWEVLTGETYVVTSDSNRVGVRLDGPVLGRAVAAELPSEGLVRGAVQVPPSGLPLVFLADHPVTGGYPVIANVVDDDVDALAQLRPGDRLRLRPT